jgi:hypothetical protein
VSGIGPGIQLSVEAGLWKLGPGVLTLGGEFGASFFSYTYDGYVYNGKFYPDHAYKYSWTNIILAARSAYHYGWDVKGLDTYGGIALGMRFMVFHRTYYANYNGYLEDYNPSMVSPHGGIFVGTSYFFSPVVGVNGELGFNVTYAQIGLILKVK